MSGKHKKNRDAERKQKRQSWSIDRSVAEMEDSEQIRREVTIQEEMPDYNESLKENFLFSFVHYKSDQCGLKDLTGDSSGQLIRKLKNINKTTLSGLPNSRLIKDNINNSGDYAILYRGLSKDVEIKEIAFSDSGRIFAYFVDRYVCIVSIKPNHINTR